MTAEHCDIERDSVEQSPGQRLKAAREKAGLTERQVAESLKLLPDQITCIEKDNFERFISPLFCKAHLKAYSQLVGLNASDIIELYQSQFAGDVAKTDKPLKVTPIQRPKRGNSFKYWGAAAALVVSVTLWKQHNQQVIDPVTISSAEQTVNVEVDGNDQSSLLGLGHGAATQAAGPELIKVMANAEEMSQETDEQSSVVIDLPARDNGSGELSAANTNSVDNRDVDELRFVFTDDCWVEVTDGNGDIIFASLKQADETLKLTGTGPFKVLLGYAHGVSLAYNGEPIEINVKNRNNSARFVVGNLPVQ